MVQSLRVDELIAEAQEQERLQRHSISAFARREDERISADHKTLGVRYERESDGLLLDVDESGVSGHGKRSEAAELRLRDGAEALGKRIAKQDVDADWFLLELTATAIATMAKLTPGEREPRVVRPFRWPSELAALKGDYHVAEGRGLSNAGKIGEHMLLGSSIPTTGVAPDGPDGPDPFFKARAEVLATFDPKDLELLRLAFIALPDPPQRRRPSKKARVGDCVRCYPKGKFSRPHEPKCPGRDVMVVGDALPMVPRGSAESYAAQIARGDAERPNALSNEHTSWWHLVALFAGELAPLMTDEAAATAPELEPHDVKSNRAHSPQGPVDVEGISRRLRERVMRARRELRVRLAAVDLGEGRQTRWLVPAKKGPKDRESKAPDEVVAACMGIRIVDGCREPCEVRPVDASAGTAASWPRCDVCGWPKARAGSAAA
jgi:hypothetical protein